MRLVKNGGLLKNDKIKPYRPLHLIVRLFKFVSDSAVEHICFFFSLKPCCWPFLNMIGMRAEFRRPRASGGFVVSTICKNSRNLCLRGTNLFGNQIQKVKKCCAVTLSSYLWGCTPVLPLIDGRKKIQLNVELVLGWLLQLFYTFSLPIYNPQCYLTLPLFARLLKICHLKRPYFVITETIKLLWLNDLKNNIFINKLVSFNHNLRIV